MVLELSSRFMDCSLHLGSAKVLILQELVDSWLGEGLLVKR
jgi:hypothetical protein